MDHNGALASDNAHTTENSSSTDGALAEPFSTVFDSRQEAEQALDLIREMARILGITRPGDPRLVVSLTDWAKTIHVSFCQWLLLGFYSPARKPLRRLIALREDASVLLPGRAAAWSLSEKPDGNRVSVFRITPEELHSDSRVRDAFFDTLSIMAKRGASHRKSAFKKHDEELIQEAVFDPIARDRVLTTGIALNKDSPSLPHYWVFQCNPNMYKIADALRAGHARTWTVRAHQNQIRAGDKVIVWVTGARAGCYGLATVIADPYLDMEDESEMEYWTDASKVQPELRCRLKYDFVLADAPILNEVVRSNPVLKTLKRGHQGTNFAATKEQYEELARLAELRVSKDQKPKRVSTTKDPPQTWPINPTYSLAQMAQDTGFSQTELDSWVRGVHRKGQVILYGPPGTGKTFMAQRLARHLVGGGDGFHELVQFHPAYAYEDFIQGVRVKSDSDGRPKYVMQPGRFLEFCKRAEERSGTCVLIIDEINRANLARVFGELMYLLEYRNEQVPLAGDGRLFSIPTNVRIIGTMNTADRSIALVDHALRRRFSFVPLRPKMEVLRRYHQSTEFPVEQLIRLLEKVNSQIDDPDFELGISFFMTPDLSTHLEDIWRTEIEPYLEEYFYGRPEAVNALRWEKVKGGLVK